MHSVAVLDLGSNSVRLSIASVDKGFCKTIFMKRNMVKLSEAMNNDMILKEPAIERTINALIEFKQIISDFECDNIIAVATAAVRKAKNQSYFLEKIKNDTGININVIDGLNEAKLDFYGVLNNVPFDDFLIMDIGGGSTEIISAEKRSLHFFESIPFGSRSITEDFLQPETSENVIRAEKIIDEKISSLNRLSALNGIPIVGLGGCFGAVAKALNTAQSSEDSNVKAFDTKKIIELYDHIKSISVEERKGIKGIGSERGDIILGGLMPFISVAKRIKPNFLFVSDSGIRDGILYALCNGLSIL